MDGRTIRVTPEHKRRDNSRRFCVALTDAGELVIVGIAFITAAFAIAQTIGLRRM